MKRIAAVALSLALAVAGCDNGTGGVAAAPTEPDSHSAGYYCGMSLAEHAGPKGQLLLKGAVARFWFTSVRDALTYVGQDLVSEGEIDGFWVNDMGMGTWERPAAGSWIAADGALYVIGSNKTATMGGLEIVPFKERAKAEAFIHEFGGRIIDYAAVREEVVAAQTGAENDGALR
ncbi:MAG: nitrous oxide reductase accessory protein NosL [Hyphomicrobium sp.]|uniref:nitrous oxide reductase accessory protein NosL n=1 Tax=Hyphomicrobium sp. TaxID=82 RepID=UPI0013238320|nr:nitrous oxide reductase accessory protein NosL [Hyphomicrobium sp.]KAB2943161.1 MAG: copper resistance protein CopZ [Hyphomicrobium sp.]MBZ0208789.1 nitrous oxide reductase accessory protein NosL [Hyphomicrobium sp.]